MNKQIKNKSIFIDRDGVINKEVDHLNKITDLQLLPWVSEWLQKINKSDFLSIVITNQAAVAKWFLTEEYLQKIHKALIDMLDIQWAYVDDIFYCPHHIDWIVSKYAIDCNCRKPKIWMIKKAVEKYNIDLAQSFLIWDMTWDIQLWVNAWLKTILVKTGYAWKDWRYDCTPDFVCENFLDAVNLVLAYKQ